MGSTKLTLKRSVLRAYCCVVVMMVQMAWATNHTCTTIEDRPPKQPPERARLPAHTFTHLLVLDGEGESQHLIVGRGHRHHAPVKLPARDDVVRYAVEELLGEEAVGERRRSD